MDYSNNFTSLKNQKIMKYVDFTKFVIMVSSIFGDTKIMTVC